MNGHDKKERADVVILTYHPDERFTECIRRLKKQAEPPGHIYVVNTRTDCFPEEVERMEGVTVKHIDREEFDHGATRDMGFSLSDAGIVIFMTQDALPADKELTANLVRSLLDSEKIGISYARQLPAKDCGMIERYTRNFNYPNESRVKGQEDISELGIKTFFCSDVCAAYKRSIYQEMGGFIRHTIFNEDMIMAAKMVRAGYQIAYAAEARVVHFHNYTGRQQFRRNFDMAVSHADHPEVFAGISSEAEGIRLVLHTARYLLKKKKPHLIVELIYKSGCKYLGYKMGRNYRRLPLWIVKKCSLSRAYWEKTC